MQSRVESLHHMLNEGGETASKWIKERGAPERLTTVDAAQLVPTANQSCCGYGYKIEQLTSVAPDLLGRAVLDEAASTGDDPDEAKVRKTPSWPSATRVQKSMGQLQPL